MHSSKNWFLLQKNMLNRHNLLRPVNRITRVDACPSSAARSSTDQLDLYGRVLDICLAQKCVSPLDEQVLTIVREKFRVSEEQHVELLMKKGTTLDQWDAMRSRLLLQKEEHSEKIHNCVICQQRTSEFLVMNCMHLCICQECSTQRDMEFCPKCTTRISEIRRVYY